jgi:hypothetical protein
MKRRQGLVKGTTLWAIPLLVLVTSCKNLKTVEEFSQTSVRVKTTATLVSNDAYASCLRTARQYKRYKPLKPTDEGNITPPSLDEKIPIFPSADSFKAIEENEKACDTKKEDADIITQANTTLTNYMEALGRLASGDTVKFDQNLDALEKSINGLTGLVPNAPTDEINSGLKIARFIFNQFTLAFRRENIKEAILCANQSISEYTDGLKFVGQKYYIEGTLRNERIAMDNYYQSLKPDISAQPSQASERIATFILRRQYGDELVALSNREQAGQAYIQILSETAKTHNELRDVFADGKNMNEQEIKDFCKPIFTEKDSSGKTGALPVPVSPMLAESETITPPAKAISLTPSESELIARILRDYQRKVEPLALEVTQALGNN